MTPRFWVRRPLSPFWLGKLSALSLASQEGASDGDSKTLSLDVTDEAFARGGVLRAALIEQEQGTVRPVEEFP